MRWFWRGIWNLSEFTGIGLGKLAPTIFGLMIGRKGKAMSSRQSTYNARAARALRILRKIAKDFGYSVGGHGGSEIDDFMDDIESGKVIVTQAHKVDLQPNKSYWQGDDKEN
jgi:hypothetical protein